MDTLNHTTLQGDTIKHLILASFLAVLYPLSGFGQGGEQYVWIPSWQINMGSGTNGNYGNMPVQILYDYADAADQFSMFAATIASDGSSLRYNNMVSSRRRPLNDSMAARGKPVYLCIGGAGAISNLRSAFSDAYRSTTVSMLTNAVVNDHYAGLDIDWEPISHSDMTNIRATVTALYQEFQKHSAYYDASKKPGIVFTMNPGGSDWGSDFAPIEPYLEMINLMTYDKMGTWTVVSYYDCAVTARDSNGNLVPGQGVGSGRNLEPATMERQANQMVGFPLSKINVGIDVMGARMTGVTAPWQTIPSGVSINADYKFFTFYQDVLQGRESSVHYDPIARAYWMTYNGNFYTFMGAPGMDKPLRETRDFAVAKGYHGFCFWDLTEAYVPGLSSADDRNWAGVQLLALRGSAPPPPPPPDEPKIKGSLFFDQNQNGSRGTSEPPMAGWNVTLAGADNAVLMTDSSGSFSFDALPLGDYTVTLQQKTGWSRTLPASSYSYSVSVDSANQVTSLEFGLYSSNAYGFPVNRQWNIVSLPVTVPDRSVAAVFPLHLTTAYAFDAGYLERSVLQYGAGYWIKFPFGHTVWLSGNAMQSDTTAVNTGWNFIGSVSAPIPVSNLRTIPAGILNPYVYGYANGSYVAETIEPGQGYWINALEPGQVIVSSAPDAEMDGRAGITRTVTPLNRVSFGIPSGENANIYYVVTENGDEGVTFSAAPPAVPDRTFQAGYTGATAETDLGMIATVGGGTPGVTILPLVVRGAGSDLTVSWEIGDAGTQAELSGDGGLRQTLSGSGSVSLKGSGEGTSGDRRFTLRVSSDGETALPKEFSLAQNYPNPFNSTTYISFSLPVAGRVILEVFNIVGERIATLADDTMEAGNQSLPFEASTIASGMYFYRITVDGGDAGRFTATKKMLLIR